MFQVRVVVVCCTLALAACGGGGSASTSTGGSGGAGGSTSGGTCTLCSTAEPTADAYGQPCDIDPATEQAMGWRGGAVCCDDAGVRYAACVTRAIAGKPCDVDFPVSCDKEYTCRQGLCELH